MPVISRSAIFAKSFFDDKYIVNLPKVFLMTNTLSMVKPPFFVFPQYLDDFEKKLFGLCGDFFRGGSVIFSHSKGLYTIIIWPGRPKFTTNRSNREEYYPNIYTNLRNTIDIRSKTNRT